MKNIEIAKLASILGVKSDKKANIHGYAIDSREVERGDLFFALKGERHDGHQFLADVAKKGACGAVVESSYQGEDFGLNILRVPNVLAALQQLARVLIQQTRVVGITGSVGKTTTKEFVWTLLKDRFHAGRNHLNKNTQITLPQTILQRDGSEKMMILEMGMSQKGDIGKLLKIVSPEIALITAISLAHAVFNPGGIQEIAEGKFEIFSHPATKLALFPYELLCYAHLVPCKMKTYSMHDERADFFLKKEKEGYRIYESQTKSPTFTLPFEESHFIHNSLAAITIARSLGMSYEEIIPILPNLKPPIMRFEKIEKGGILFINDAYNASPLSVKTALSNLPIVKGKRIAVLGEMRELGSFTEASHKEIGTFAIPYVDHVLCLGEQCRILCDEFSKSGKPAELFFTHDELKTRLHEIMKKNDVVLVKGSRAMHMEKILE